MRVTSQKCIHKMVRLIVRTLFLQVVLLHSAFAEHVCSAWIEIPYFKLMPFAAGCAQDSDIQKSDSVKITQISKPVGNGQSIGGFKIEPLTNERKGRILVIQGNGHRVSDLVGDFSFFAEKEYEVIMYDYRGYGLSSGANGSVKSNIEDYQAIVSQWATGDIPIIIYAMSWGGIVILNSLSGDEKVSLLVLDSVPDKIPKLGCPETYDPANRILKMKMPTVMIVSGKDGIFKRNEQVQLIRAISNNASGKVVERPDFHHPFTCGLSHRDRLLTLLNIFDHD